MNSQSVFRCLALLVPFFSAAVPAAPPQMYHRPTYESPIRGEPDDLLLLAGYGFASDDTVVYRAIRGMEPLAAPDTIPPLAGGDQGVAPIVSAADVPYSLTIKLPQAMRADQTYALWVRTAGGEWSHAVTINDARPLWLSPGSVYASNLPGGLPRELKIVGRNLQPSPGQATRIRLEGPERFTVRALADAKISDTLPDYVARMRLPEHLAPGRYRAMVSRDGTRWVALEGQTLDVLPDPPAPVTFSVSDAQFGGCRPDDGADDTVCILRAIAAAARSGGGIVYFDAGNWELIDSNQPGVTTHEGIRVPEGVQLRGAGSAVTHLERHAAWNAHAATAGFTLLGHTLVTGFTFRDLQVYRPDDHAGPYLQLGEDWQRTASGPAKLIDAAVVDDVVITHNVFDKPMVAIGAGGLPMTRLIIAYNTFGAYQSALELTGDQFDMVHKYRIDDSVIDYNIFKPGARLDVIQKTGTIASEIGAGHRLDFTGNTADGASTDYLYTPDDAKGWRAAFFWSTNNNVEQVLVSQNTATCTGDKIGDGEALAFDNNSNTSAFDSLPGVVEAGAGSITVAAPLVARQHNRDVPVASYYVGHWVQIVSGPGLGQARKIRGYSTDAITHLTTIRVAPDWDVVPVAGASRIAIGREYWQLYVLDNDIDNRQPLCRKSNRSRRAAGQIALWAQTADTVLAGNHQYDSDGIFVQQNYGFVTQEYTVSEHPCADCTILPFFNFFLEIRDNVVDGEYDWANDCSRSGIGVGVAAAPWAQDGPPPTVGFGVSIAHNTVRHADAQFGGAIAQANTWFSGPPPQRWPLSDNLLIHHNSIVDIDGARALPLCGTSRPRTGIAFPDPAIAWRTVLYANSCRNVSTPVGPGGIGSVAVCPSSAQDSCECPQSNR
jgi:hypothetical protein